MNNNFMQLLQPLDEVEEESYIQDIIHLGYNREEALNILNGLNPNGTKFEELPF